MRHGPICLHLHLLDIVDSSRLRRHQSTQLFGLNVLLIVVTQQRLTVPDYLSIIEADTVHISTMKDYHVAKRAAIPGVRLHNPFHPFHPFHPYHKTYPPFFNEASGPYNHIGALWFRQTLREKNYLWHAADDDSKTFFKLICTCE